MPHYLRDHQVRNISLNKEELVQINEVFNERYVDLIRVEKESEKTAFLSYIIRFDNKGYRVFSIEELLKYFDQAKNIERIIFTLESTDALASNRTQGAFLELCLDVQDMGRCLLVASSDLKDWTDLSFSAVHEVLQKFKTKHGFFRNSWTSLLAQLFGVVLEKWLRKSEQVG